MARNHRILKFNGAAHLPVQNPAPRAADRCVQSRIYIRLILMYRIALGTVMNKNQSTSRATAIHTPSITVIVSSFARRASSSGFPPFHTGRGGR